MVINVGSAAMSFLVGGEGLETSYSRGIAMVDASYMFAGAVPTAALAVCINSLLERIEKWLISPA